MKFLQSTCMALAAAAAVAAPTALVAQDLDSASATTQWFRKYAPEGTFWLDSMDEVDVVRYTSTRDISICLPEPKGVNAADRGYPLKITWDQANTAVLRPGNCLYFDAKRVSLSPAEALPANVTLTGRINASAATIR